MIKRYLITIKWGCPKNKHIGFLWPFVLYHHNAVRENGRPIPCLARPSHLFLGYCLLVLLSSHSSFVCRYFVLLIFVKCSIPVYTLHMFGFSQTRWPWFCVQSVVVVFNKDWLNYCLRAKLQFWMLIWVTICIKLEWP